MIAPAKVNNPTCSEMSRIDGAIVDSDVFSCKLPPYPPPWAPIRLCLGGMRGSLYKLINDEIFLFLIC